MNGSKNGIRWRCLKEILDLSVSICPIRIEPQFYKLNIMSVLRQHLFEPGNYFPYIE